MAGQQSRALKIVSQTQSGAKWDPTDMMGDFDHDPKDGRYTGRLPEGTPDSFPEDHPPIGPFKEAPLAPVKGRFTGNPGK